MTANNNEAKRGKRAPSASQKTREIEETDRTREKPVPGRVQARPNGRLPSLCPRRERADTDPAGIQAGKIRQPFTSSRQASGAEEIPGP